MQRRLNQLFRVFFSHKPVAEILKKYHIPARIALHVEQAPDGWYVVSSPDLPGLITQARSQEELIEMINDAVLTYFDVPRREADIIYDKIFVENEMLTSTGELHAQVA